jgi:hypothetical protein
MSIRNAIYILETCEEGSFGNFYDYDSLPKPVKDAVDKALASQYHTFTCDIYDQGLQFLMSYERTNKVDLKIKSNETVLYKGNVELIHD